MFFKRMLCMTLLLASTGCGLKIGDSQAPVSPINTDLGGVGTCLTDTAPAWAKFLNGTALPEQMTQLWDCYASAIKTFDDSVHGSYKDRFTSRELENFVEHFLLIKPISDSLITEVFRIKRMLVGGDAGYITRAEMSNLISVLGSLKQISIEILPYMRVYSSNWKVGGYSTIDQDVEYFEAANLEIQKAAKDLATLIEKNGQSYPLDSVVTLLTEIQNLTGSNWPWIATIQDAMPLVQKLKQTLSGGDGNVVAPTEWSRFSLLGSRAYIQYLRFHYFIQNFDAGGAGPQLIYIMNSVSDLFSYLGDMVEGKPDKVLTRQELLEICQALSNFFPDLHITDDFLLEVMKIKVVFFGGQLDKFVKADFDRAQEKLLAFQTLSGKFLTYISVYGMSWNVGEMTPEEAQTFFQQSDANLAEVGRRLGQIMEAPYDLNDLIKLAKGIDNLLPSSDHSGASWESLANQYVPLVVSAKNLVFADQDSVIGKNTGDWSDLLQVSAQGYSRVLYYYYFLRNSSWLTGPSLNYLNTLVRDGADLIDQLILRRPSSPTPTITFAELSRVWASVLKTGILPEKMSQKSLDNLTKIILQKILIHPNRRLVGDLPNGLTKEATQMIREEFGMWLEGQSFMDLMFQGLPADSVKTPLQVLNDINHAAPTTELSELKMVFSGPVPLTYDSLDRLHIGGTPVNYSHRSMNWANFSRAVVRLILRSYAMDLKRVNNYGGITSDEAKALYADIRPVVTELNLFDLRDDEFMNNRFRDANLFTPRGNGDGYADFIETNELVMMLLSGVQVDGMISPLVQAACPVIPSTTGYEDDGTMDMACFQKSYYAQMEHTYSSLPDFLNFAYGLPVASYYSTLTNLMKAAGYVPDNSGRVKIGDTSMLPHITQYVESLFATYDADHNGKLNTAELEKAYPRFHDLVKSQAPSYANEHMVKALFFWLVHYKKAPATTYEEVKFVVWWFPKSSWDVSADRQSFAEILGFIADALADANKNKAKAFAIPEDIHNNPDHYHSIVPAGGYPEEIQPNAVDPNDI
jgi:hypothetical protein